MRANNFLREDGVSMNSGKIDLVTKLPNIYAFMDVMREQAHTKQYSAVMKLVLNRFQRINSIYSYEFGDKVLADFAQRLQILVQANGDVYRMDGTKFAICLHDVEEPDVMRLYEEIRRLAHSEVVVDYIPVTLTISGGALLLDAFAGNEQDILTAVTQALLESKNEYHGDLVLFEDNLEDDVREQMALMNTVTKSIYEGCKGFYLLYQPIVKPDTGELSGAEVLLRWKHDFYGYVSPAEFIPWVENNPCFLDLGEWMLRQAMAAGKRMLAIYPEFMLSVNLSYSQLERDDFRSSFVSLLEEFQFPPDHICLELTERCYNVDLTFLKEEALFFKGLGAKLVLDDFGTEYSSLKLLCELPIDRLKIDASFVKGIIDNPTKQIMVETVVQCAHRLGIVVCIEGIENEEIRQFVKQYGVARHQGYYYAKPLEEDVLAELLRQNPVFEPLV